MANKAYFSILIILFWGCRRSEPVEKAKTVIIAQEIDIQAMEVYLTTMDDEAVVLDTAKVSNGSFQFSFKDEFDPFKACIVYRNEYGKMSMVYFKNDNPDSVNSTTYSEFFIAERGTTNIKGMGTLNDQYVFASVVKGEENKLIFNPGYEVLANIDNSSKEKYEATFTVVKNHIENYPYSFILMDRFYHNRGNYKKHDLEYILSKAEGNVRESANSYNLSVYLKNLPDDYDPFKAFPILNKNRVYVTNYDRRKKLNMMILTTTWSHPSILLLYHMNLERKNFENQDLYIVDIGVDEVADWWMEYKIAKGGEFVWDQLYVPPKMRQNFLGLRAFTGFPLVIFTDKEGLEVKRFYDMEYRNLNYNYNSKNLEEIKKFIADYFNNN